MLKLEYMVNYKGYHSSIHKHKCEYRMSTFLDVLRTYLVDFYTYIIFTNPEYVAKFSNNCVYTEKKIRIKCEWYSAASIL